MKAIFAMVVVVFSIVFQVESQGFIINQGESALFSFTGLDFFSTNTNLFSVVEARLFGSPGALASGESLQMEYFADSSGLGTPFLTQAITNTSVGVYWDAIGFITASSAWDDLDGSVRVTMLTGDTLLQFIRFKVDRPGETFISVQTIPEPDPWSLLLTGGAVFLLAKILKPSPQKPKP